MNDDNIEIATAVSGGSFMHVHQAIVNLVENDLRNAHIMLKTGIDAFSGAVSGNMKLKKLLTQNIIPDMIINAQDSLTNNIILDFKSLCSTSTKYKQAEGKFGGGVRAAVKNLDLTENGNPPREWSVRSVQLRNSQ
jgi:vesicle coat complex subunit